MTPQGTIVLDLLGLLLLGWILHLTLGRKLYIGYGVVLSAIILLAMLLTTWELPLRLLTRAVGAVFPASALTLVALGSLFALLTYVLVQLSILSEQVRALAQHVAIRDVMRERGHQQEGAPPDEPLETTAETPQEGA